MGEQELGIFLSFFGMVQVLNNLFMIKATIRRIGPEKTMICASAALCVGITSYTFIDLLAPGEVAILVPYFAVFLLFIGVPYAYHLPTLVTIAGSVAPPSLRGKATGLVAAGMSLGFCLCPLVSGSAFASDVLRFAHKYGTFSHLMWLVSGGVLLIELALIVAFIGVGSTKKAK